MLCNYMSLPVRFKMQERQRARADGETRAYDVNESKCREIL